MEKYELKNIDGEDLVDLVSKIEGSLSIEFEDGELAHILTFGEFCDYILNKIELENSDDCTTQQAFYKLRKVIVTVLNIENKSVYPNTLLDDLFPRKSRIEDVRKIEDELGFKLNILEPPQFLTWILAITFLGSFILVFTMFEIGIIIFIFSLLSLRVNFKMAKEFSEKTVGEVAEKMTRDYYLKSRRNSKTVNRNEIENTIIDLFSHELALDKSDLMREANFN